MSFDGSDVTDADEMLDPKAFQRMTAKTSEVEQWQDSMETFTMCPASPSSHGLQGSSSVRATSPANSTSSGSSLGSDSEAEAPSDVQHVASAPAGRPTNIGHPFVLPPQKPSDSPPAVSAASSGFARRFSARNAATTILSPEVAASVRHDPEQLATAAPRRGRRGSFIATAPLNGDVIEAVRRRSCGATCEAPISAQEFVVGGDGCQPAVAVSMDVDPAALAAEWMARLQSETDFREEQKSLCRRILVKMRPLVPAILEMSSEDHLRLMDRISKEVEKNGQILSKISYKRVAMDWEELRSLRITSADVDNKLAKMNRTCLQELSAQRDQRRTSAFGVQVALEEVDQKNVEFFEPLQYLSAEVRSTCLAIIDEKIKAIFEFDPSCRDCVNKIEVARFEDGLLRDKVSAYEKMNASLRDEVRELKSQAKKNETLITKLEWDLSTAEATIKRMEADLAAAADASKAFQEELLQAQRAAAEAQEELLEAQRAASEAAAEAQRAASEAAAEATAAAVAAAAVAPQQQLQEEPPVVEHVDAAVQVEQAPEQSGRSALHAVVQDDLFADVTAGQQSQEQADEIKALKAKLTAARMQIATLKAKAKDEESEIQGRMEKRVSVMQAELKAASDAKAAAEVKALQASEGALAQRQQGDNMKQELEDLRQALEAEHQARQRYQQQAADAQMSLQASQKIMDGLRSEVEVAKAGSQAAHGGGEEEPSCQRGDVTTRRLQAAPNSLILQCAAKQARLEHTKRARNSQNAETVAEALAWLPISEAATPTTPSVRQGDKLWGWQSDEMQSETSFRTELSGDENSQPTQGWTQGGHSAKKGLDDGREILEDELGRVKDELEHCKVELQRYKAPKTPRSFNKSRTQTYQESEEYYNLMEQKSRAQEQAAVQKAQLQDVMRENQVLRMSLEEVLSEVHRLTRKINKLSPGQQEDVNTDLDTIMARMEKVARTGGAHFRLNKDARLREVAANRRAQAAVVATEFETPSFPTGGPADSSGEFFSRPGMATPRVLSTESELSVKNAGTSAVISPGAISKAGTSLLDDRPGSSSAVSTRVNTGSGVIASFATSGGVTPRVAASPLPPVTQPKAGSFSITKRGGGSFAGKGSSSSKRSISVDNSQQQPMLAVREQHGSLAIGARGGLAVIGGGGGSGGSGSGTRRVLTGGF